MSPAQCRFAKKRFSKDETIFLGQSRKDKYDVDGVDIGLCLEGDVQCVQPEAGPQRSA